MIALPLTCPEFIGRRDELAALMDARRALAQSRGAFMLVGGEAGIGKTRLITHFAARTGDRRARHLAAAECLEGTVEPLAPIRALVGALFASGPPDDVPPNALRALGRIVPDRASENARALAETPVDRGDFFAGLLAFFGACARKRSTILILEDLHWADPSTLDFLTYLAPRIAGMRLLLVGTHRTETIAANPALFAALTRIEREPTVRRLVLEPLDAGETRRLLAAAAGGRARVDAATLEGIVARAEGNAFYAEELLKDAAALDRRGAYRVPLSIRGTIVERLRLFDEAERRMLAAAAVLGLRFDPAILAEVVGCALADLIPALQRAREVALVVDDPERPSWLRFRHAITRAVIVGESLAFEVQRLHRHILDTLEAHGGEPNFHALAEHAAAAGDAARTMRYAEAAGTISWGLGGFAEATLCFERALAVVSDDDDRARLIELLGFSASYDGDTRRGLAHWEEAHALRTARGEFTQAARILILIVCERFNLGEITDEGAAALAFIEAHEAEIAPRTRTSMFVLIATLRSELAHLETVDALMARVDLTGVLPEVMQNAIVIDVHRAAYAGDLAAWSDGVHRLRALSPIHANPSVEAINVTDRLASIIASGIELERHTEIEAAIARGRAIAQEWRLRDMQAHYDALEAAYALTRGRLAQARALFPERPAEMLAMTAAIFARTAPLLALALDDDGLVERAVTPDALGRDVAAVGAHPDSQYSRLRLGAYAVWLHARGRPAEAEPYLAHAFAGLPYPATRFATLVAFALRHVPVDHIPGVAAFAACERHATDLAGRALAALVAAALARHDGDEDGARAGFALSAAAFERAGFALAAAHAYHLARAADRARAILLACGATGYIRGVEDARPPQTGGLSQRELEVARLATAGLSNLEIAERLTVSTKTVEKHLASIFRKLGLRSRTQIAAHFAAAGTAPS